MSNTLLTPTIILREAGRLFHQNAKFIGTCDRQYDDRFAKKGAKVGDTIALRDPVEFSVSTGSVMQLQSVTETSQNLTLGTRKHIAFSFTAQDLTLKVDDFSERYLQKAMARLAANAEADVISQAINATANYVEGGTTNAFGFTYVAQGKQKLDEHLCPEEDRYLMLSPTHATKYLVDTKGLFTPQGKLGAQYGDGMVKDALGFNIFSTSLLSSHATGTAVQGDTLYNVSGANYTGSTITVDTGSTTFKKGDVITLAGCNACHRESKADLGYLRAFTVTADCGASTATIPIYPAIVTSGASQNCVASPTSGGAVSKLGAGASVATVESLAYQGGSGGAFVFATADLEDPSRYGQWGAVENMDGISMRIWRSADIINDAFPCRIDLFYGFLARYPNYSAVRIQANG